MFRREAADTIRVGWLALRDAPEPFNDSITEIARSNLSTVPLLVAALREAAEAQPSQLFRCGTISCHGGLVSLSSLSSDQALWQRFRNRGRLSKNL